ncbi:hypothetical protein AAX21_03760 [Oenococcus oeni]|nr:hypothetical protein AAX21_03760 [Oenococcus oeni]
MSLLNKLDRNDCLLISIFLASLSGFYFRNSLLTTVFVFLLLIRIYFSKLKNSFFYSSCVQPIFFD